MKSSRFGMVSVFLLVCTIVFWSVPSESGWLDNLAESTKKLQAAGEEAIKLKKTGKVLKGAKGTPTAAPKSDGVSTTAPAGNNTPATTQAGNNTPTTTQRAVSATMSSPLDFDIIGLKLGMTASEVKTILESRYPGVKMYISSLAFRTAKEPVKFVRSIEMQPYSSTNERVKVGFSAARWRSDIGMRSSAPPPNIVYRITRRGSFTMDDIIKKYGKPTYTDKPRETHRGRSSHQNTTFNDYSVYADGKRAENQKCMGGDKEESGKAHGLVSHATVSNKNCWVVLTITATKLYDGTLRMNTILEHPIETLSGTIGENKK